VINPVGAGYNAVASPEGAQDVSAALTGARRGADGAVAALIELRRRLGLPGALRELGIARTDLDRMAELTIAHYGSRQNVRPVTTAAEALALLQIAY
jgi:alcohol dehydrogenase class IV